jgi:hypothetical protein
MKTSTTVILLILIACATSCERKTDDVVSSSLPSLYRRSAFTAKAEGMACYTILTGDTPSGILYAIYGDGSHEIRGAGADGNFTLYDYDSEEEWNLKIDVGTQVLVSPDRTIREVGNFAKVTDSGIVFVDTEDPILKSVSDTFPKKTN